MTHIISGKYEVLSQVGRGGMGAVYKVRHLTLETILALKVLPAELAEDVDLVRRFHQEARLMAQLRHPNIVQVLDVDRDGDTHFFVMDYVEGKSLSQYLRGRGPLPLPEVLEISAQVARALENAHSHEPPIIHRDVKPANILLEERSRRVVVTDFGIAKVLGTTERTRTGMVMGTLRYCAPEQILQDKTLDGKADLYGLGLVMYEMAAGRPFFAETDERALLGRVLYGPGENVPTFPGPVSPEFVALVTRAIAREPERRYQGAADLLRDIEAGFASHPTIAPTVLSRETFSSGEERAQREEKAVPSDQRERAAQEIPPVPLPAPQTVRQEPRKTSAALSLDEKRQWWYWRPALRLKGATVLIGSSVAILSFVYALSKTAILAPSPSPMLQAYERAFTDLQAGRIEAARSAFQRVTEDRENTLGLGYDGLAAIYFEQGSLDKAKEAFQQALEANPANVMALLIQGDIFFSTGKKEQAFKAYTQATEVEAQGGWQKALAYNALGVYQTLEGREVEARNLFDKALLTDRNSCEASSNLGYLFWQAGDLQEAQRFFAKALNLQPKDEVSRAFLDMIAATESPGLSKGTGEKVLVAPFVTRGGNLRRLGEGEALAWQLVRYLSTDVRPERMSQDLLRGKQKGELLSHRTALLALAREKGATYLVSGKLQSFPTVLFIQGQVVAVAEATEKPFDHVQPGVNGRLEAAARALAERVSHAVIVAKPEPPVRETQKSGDESPPQQKPSSERETPRTAQKDPGTLRRRPPPEVTAVPERPPSNEGGWRKWIEEIPARKGRALGK